MFGLNIKIKNYQNKNKKKNFLKKKLKKKNYIFIVINLNGGCNFLKSQKLSSTHGDLLHPNIKIKFFLTIILEKFYLNF